MSGAMIILIRRRNSWVKGLKYCAQPGCERLINAPATMPTISPIMICWVRVSPRPAALVDEVADIRGILSRTACSARHGSERGDGAERAGRRSDAVASARLGGIQAAIGAFEDRVDGVARAGGGDADADRRPHARVADANVDLLDFPAHPFGDP